MSRTKTMISPGGLICQVPSEKVGEVLKIANWRILSKMKIDDIRDLPAARKIEGADQMNKKDLLEAL